MPNAPRIGVVGAGAIAKSHLEGMRANGCEVVAVADPFAAARDKFAAAHQVKAYASLAEMRTAEKLDAVTIAAPNGLHAPLACEAMDAGLSVLCEKPPSTSLAGALQMRDAARRTKKTLMMGFNHRFEPQAQQLAALREQGVFGSIYHAKAAWIRRRGIPGMGGWFTTRSIAGGGPLYDIGVHLLDRTWFIMGRPQPTSCSAVTYQKFGDIASYVYEGMWAGPPKVGGTVDTEDFAAALIRFANGASLQLEVSWAANRADEPPKSLVMGDKAGASWEGDPVTIYGELGRTIATSTLQYDRTKFDDRFRHFAKCLRGEATCTCTGDDGVAVQAMLDAVYDSAAKGREVPITIPG